MTNPTNSAQPNSQGHLGLMAAYLLLISLTSPFSGLFGEHRWARWFYAVRRVCKVDDFMSRANRQVVPKTS